MGIAKLSAVLFTLLLGASAHAQSTSGVPVSVAASSPVASAGGRPSFATISLDKVGVGTPVAVPGRIGEGAASVQKVDPGTLARLGIDVKKLDGKAYSVAGDAKTYGTGLVLVRAGAEAVPLGKGLLPAGFPLATVASALRANPRATGVLVGITAAGYTYTMIEEIALEDSFWKRNKYLLTLASFVVFGLAGYAWAVRKKATG